MLRWQEICCQHVADTKKTGGDAIKSVIFNFLQLTSNSYFFISGLNLSNVGIACFASQFVLSGYLVTPCILIQGL